MTISELQPDQLDELAALEQRVLTTDPVRLKLEWATIREARTAASLVVADGDRIIGFCGLYAFGGPPNVELIGMVDPQHRRRGIATQLLDRALEICEQRGFTHCLAIVPRGAQAATALVTAAGAALEHSEYTLGMDHPPHRSPADPATTLRDATAADHGDRMRILTAGFGPQSDAMLTYLHGDGFSNVMVDHAGVTIGCARLSFEDGHGYIGGFAIDPEYRGRGIGRDALGRLCELLRDQGCPRVELQVAVENDRALGLYTSTGFAPVSTEDYYLLANVG